MINKKANMVHRGAVASSLNMDPRQAELVQRHEIQRTRQMETHYWKYRVNT